MFNEADETQMRNALNLPVRSAVPKAKYANDAIIAPAPNSTLWLVRYKGRESEPMSLDAAVIAAKKAVAK